MSNSRNLDMTSSTVPEISSYEDPLENLETTLADITESWLPGYATHIQHTNPFEVESIMTDLMSKSMSKPLKDKALTKMLGSLAFVEAARLKNAYELIERTRANLATS